MKHFSIQDHHDWYVRAREPVWGEFKVRQVCGFCPLVRVLVDGQWAYFVDGVPIEIPPKLCHRRDRVRA